MLEQEEISQIIAELYEKMQREIYDANRILDEDELNRVLLKWNYDSEEGDRFNEAESMKVLVIGESKIEQRILEKCLEELGMPKEQFTFVLEYENNYNFRQLKNSKTYSDVIVGEIPHNVRGGGDSSSGIAELENHPDQYPNTIRCVDSGGNLNINKSSFTQAIKRTIAYKNVQENPEIIE